MEIGDHMTALLKYKNYAFDWRQHLEDVRLTLRENRADERVLDVILLLRYLVLLIITIRFGLMRSMYDSIELSLIRASIIIGFLYLFALGIMRGWKSSWFNSGFGKAIQVVVDSIGAAWLLILSHNVSSDLFLLYLFPLYVATSHFRLRWSGVGFIWIALNHLTSLIVTQILWPSSFEVFGLVLLYVFRQGFLAVLGLAFLSERSFRKSDEWFAKRSSFKQLFEESGDGVYVSDASFRLSYLSETLRKRFGEDYLGKPCYEFMVGRDTPCPGCVLENKVQNRSYASKSNYLEVKTRGRDGKSRRAIIETLENHDAQNQLVQVIGSLRDLELYQSWEEETRQLIRHIDRDRAHDREELQRKEAHLRQQLTTLFDISSISIAVDVRSQYQRILQGTLELLECQAGTLRLLGTNPSGQESLVLEASMCTEEQQSNESRYLDLSINCHVVNAFKTHCPVMCPDILSKSGSQFVHYLQNARVLNLRGQLSLPLLLSDRPVGTLTVYRRKVGTFTSDEIRLGEALARFLAAGVAIRQEVNRRQGTVQALTDLGQHLAGISTIDELLHLAAERAQHWLHAETSAIFLLEHGRLARKKISGIDDNWFQDESYGRGEGITGAVLPPSDGLLCGLPQTENKVDLNERVPSANLRKYQLKLKSHQVKHLAAVPLNGHAGSFGVLRVVNKLDLHGQVSQVGFTKEDEDLLYSLASQIAVAIDNVRHLEEANKHVRELEELHQVSEKMAATLQPDEVMNTLVRLARELTGADYTAFVLFDGQNLVTSYENAASKDMQPLHLRARQGGITRQIIDNNKEMYFPNVRPEDEEHNIVLRQMNVRSYLGIPLAVQDRVLGVLFVHSHTVNAFDKSRFLLRTLANEAAVALQRAELFIESRKRIEELTILNDVMVHLVEVEDQDELLKSVAEGARRLAKASDTHIFLYDEKTKKFQFGAAAFAPGLVPNPIKHVRPNGFTAFVANQGQIEVIENTLQHPLYENHSEWQLGSIAGLPLERGNHMIGVLTVAYKDPHKFSDDELKALGLIARQASVAVQKTSLYQQVGEQKDRLQQYVSEAVTRLVEHTNLDGLYSFIVEVGKRFLGVEDCSLSIIESETNEIYLVASTSLPPSVYGDNPTLVRNVPRVGLTAYVAATGQHLRLIGDEIQTHPAWSGRYTEHLQYLPSGNSKGLLIVPMRRPDGTIVGVLKAENKVNSVTGEEFSEFDEEILSTLANQAAASIDRVREIKILTKQAAQRERGQLAGDLHRATNIIGMGVRVPIEKALEYLNLQDSVKANSELDQAWRAAGYTYDTLSNIMQDLRDPILLEKGLGPALRNYASLVRKDPVEIIVLVDDSVRFDPQIEHVLYRIAQEAINNSLKHGKLGFGGIISITIGVLSGCIKLVAEDNGVGFTLPPNDNILSLGLRDIEDLARSVQSKPRITSVQGTGTRIEVVVPDNSGKDSI